MQYTYLGATGLKVSRICLGTMNFGMNTDEQEAFRIMDMALDAGVNFFDTANMYGSLMGKGRPGWTEEIIGRWFALGGGRREKVVLATKVFADMHDPLDGPNSGEGLSAYKIRRHVEASMKRLQTDHLEIVYMHGYDPHAGWDELYDAFDVLRHKGAIDYLGCSNFAARQVCYAQEAAHRRNEMGLAVSQHRYNPLYRIPELELNPACHELGLGVTAYSPLGMGLLSGSYRRPAQEKERSGKFRSRLSPELLKTLEDYTKVCEETGQSEADTTFAWILSNPHITSVVAGPRTCGQLSVLKAADLVLDQETIRQIDQLFPGPDR